MITVITTAITTVINNNGEAINSCYVSDSMLSRVQNEISLISHSFPKITL